MDFRKSLSEFAKTAIQLKQAYAEENNCNPEHLFINIDQDDDITIIPTDEKGYVESFRGWLGI